MAYRRYVSEATSQWMQGGGPESDIVLSSRVRLARNLNQYPFPILFVDGQAKAVREEVERAVSEPEMQEIGKMEMIQMEELSDLEKRVLVEKHLISPLLVEESRYGAVVFSDNESVSIMVNEEDHLRIQCLYPGLQLHEALKLASRVDDILDKHVDYAFNEDRGYLTSCPTNVGTGMRGSVMIHLPALVISRQAERILSAISQVGLVVRGVYGEGSEAIGNLFQISNQITLGQTEEEIIDNIYRVVTQIIRQERQARDMLLQQSGMQLKDRIFRSLGILSHAQVIDSKEASQRLSDVKLGVDLGLIDHVPGNLMTELLTMTQPGFLQQMAGRELSSSDRDVRRATLIRHHLRKQGRQA